MMEIETDVESSADIARSRRTIWFALGTLFVVLTVLALVRIDVVVYADGALLPVERVHLIEAATAGQIKEVYVTEGAKVQRGQPLVQLAVGDVVKQRDSVKKLWEGTLTRAATLSSLISCVSELIEMRGERCKIAAANGLPEARRLLSALKSHIAQASVYDQQIKVIEAEINKLKSARFAAQRKFESVRELQADKLIAELEVVSAEEDYNQVTASMYVAEERERGVQTEREAADAKWHERLQDELQAALVERREVIEKEARLSAELESLDIALDRSLLNAPSDGFVQEINVSEHSSFVAPGDVVMKLVPEARGFKLEGRVSDRDIAFIDEGMMADVQIVALPFTEYGALRGRVEKVSVDVIEDQEPDNSRRTYKVEIAITEEVLTLKGAELTAGMTARAAIRTTDRRILDYFLSPLRAKVEETFTQR